MRIFLLCFLVVFNVYSHASERWYEDNNLHENGAVPPDFFDRLQQGDQWKDSRQLMHVYYLRYATYRDHLKGNSELLDQIANAFNEYNVTIALDDTAAVWTHSSIKDKDPNYQKSIDTLNELINHGFDVKYIGLQSVLSKPLQDSDGNEHHYPMSLRYKDVSVYFDKIRPLFPEIKIGIIDALPAKVRPEEYEHAYLGLINHLNTKGYELDFLHLDMPMSYPRDRRNGMTFEKLADIEDYVKNTLNTTFGLFVTDDFGGGRSNESFSKYALSGLQSYLEVGGRADHYVLSAWYEYPDYTVPDNITTNPPTALSIFRKMGEILNYEKIFNSEFCAYHVYRVLTRGNHDVTYPSYTPDGLQEGPAFKARCFPSSARRPVFNCTTNGHNTFVSTDQNCEGHSKKNPSLIGYIYRNSNGYREPIYRCRAGSDHFITTSYSECTSHTYGGILGYSY